MIEISLHDANGSLYHHPSDYETPLDILLADESTEQLHKAIAALPKRWSEVVCKRWGIGTVRMSQVAIANEFMISRQRVVQIEQQSMRRIRNLLP